MALELLLGDLLITDLIQEVDGYWQKRMVISVEHGLYFYDLYQRTWSSFGDVAQGDMALYSFWLINGNPPVILTDKFRYILTRDFSTVVRIDPIPQLSEEHINTFIHRGHLYGVVLNRPNIILYRLTDSLFWEEACRFKNLTGGSVISGSENYVYIKGSNNYQLYNLETKVSELIPTDLEHPYMGYFINQYLLVTGARSGGFILHSLVTGQTIPYSIGYHYTVGVDDRFVYFLNEAKDQLSRLNLQTLKYEPFMPLKANPDTLTIASLGEKTFILLDRGSFILNTRTGVTESLAIPFTIEFSSTTDVILFL